MSILLASEWHSCWGARPADCYFCESRLAEDAVSVMWFGAQPIVLHPSCAETFGCQLIQDAREADLAGSPAPHWRTRAGHVVRHGLVRQEMAS